MSGKRDGYVSASELARLGACEREIVFDRHRGTRVLPERGAARERGNKAHERFFVESQAIATMGTTRKGACFIATAVYGESAEETIVLRALRDGYLRRSVSGRWLIGAYYRVSRPIAARLEPGGTIARGLALALRPLVRAVEVFMREEWRR